MIWKRNLPNVLSLSRIILTVFFLFFLFSSLKYSNLIALIIFALASITDYLDGKVARWYNSTSRLGIFLDPLADKILIIAAFISFVELELIPAWMVIVILAREFLITGLRLVAASFGNSIPASRIAKHKTVSQIIAIYLILIFLSLKEYDPAQNLLFYFQDIIIVFMYLTIILTIVSGFSYLKDNRYVFRRR